MGWLYRKKKNRHPSSPRGLHNMRLPQNRLKPDFQMMHIPDKLYRLGLKVAYKGFVLFCFVFRPRTRGVVVAVYFEDRVLIIKNSYYRKYTIPGGYVKRGESPRMAAVRELREEVGLQVNAAKLHLKDQVATQINYKREILTFFSLELSAPTGVKQDNREVIWAEFVPLQEALNLNLSADTRRCLEFDINPYER
jgi:8-oxo-dGTP pyrophosphatase MutT (NUDIX family)